MAYTITLTDGTIFAVVPDGTINTQTSVTLVGKNYAGYGDFLDENFIHLLENFSNSTAPIYPLTGQLYFNNSESRLYVYRGTNWKVISGATSSSSPPTANVVGDLWWDSTNDQLNVWSGADGGNVWKLAGPVYTRAEGKTGAFPIEMLDVSSGNHVVTGMYSNGTLVSITSTDSTFTPAGGYVTTFPKIFTGTTVRTTGYLSGNLINDGNLYISAAGGTNIVNVTGTGANVAGYVSVSGNITGGNINTSGLVTAGGNVTGANIRTGGSVSATGSAYAASFSTNGTVSAAGDITGGNFYTAGQVSAGGNVKGSNLNGGGLSLSGSVLSPLNSSYNISTSGTVTGATLVGTVLEVNSITHSGSNASGNIGSASNYFNRVFATATSALYADLAERFEADEYMPAGTVVELGGEKEITRAREELTDEVFGVISTNAAYLMNGAAGSDETHPPIAMTGRVPVMVTGKVRKGQRLVTAGNGVARAAKPGEATPFNVIGRALKNKLDEGVGTVEAIVTIK